MMSFHLLLAVLLFLFIGWRAVHPVKLSWGWKTVLYALTALATGKFLIVRLLGGEMFFAPQLPRWFLILSSLLYTSAVIFFLLLVLELLPVCLLALLDYWRKSHWGESFRRVRGRVHLVMLVLSVLTASYGIYFGLRLPAVKEISVVTKISGETARTIRIAAVSDIHVDRIHGRKQTRRLVEKVNALKPDLILLLGDYVDGRLHTHREELEPLKDLSAPLGVYGVPGNHEYYSGYREWMDYLSSQGIQMLLNRHVVKPGFVLAGVTDSAGRRSGEELPSVSQALYRAPKELPVLLMSHNPKIMADAVRHQVDLQLSGHTHGGMVPLLSRVVAARNNGRVRGFYREGKTVLYITSGAGIWNGFPVRLGIPSEIVLLHWKLEPGH